MDITLRTALSCNREAHLHAADHDGTVLVQARQDKETTYPELASSGRYKLVVLAIETGGRWSEEAVPTTQQLAHASSRGSIVHAIPCGAPVGTTLDQNVGCVLRSLLRRVSCGACAKHHLVSNGRGTTTPC